MARNFFGQPKGSASWFKLKIYYWREAMGWASAVMIVTCLGSIALAATVVDVWW